MCPYFNGKKGEFLFWWTFALILIVIGIGLYFDINQAQSVKRSGPIEKITIAGGPTLSSAPLYVALDKGYFKREGLDVSYQPFPSGHIAVGAVKEGKVDFGLATEAPIMAEGMEGTRIWIIATISEAHKVVALVGRKDKGISTPNDLKGKRIGVVKGSNGEFFLDIFLTFNKISKKEVRPIPMVPDKAYDILIKGEVDAVVTWDFYKQRLQKELGTNGVVFYGRDIYRMTWNLMAMQDYVKRNPEVVKKVLRALIRGVASIRGESLEARKITANYFKMDEAVLNEIWDASDLSFGVTLSPTLLISMEDQARWAIRNKLTKRKTVPNFLNFIYFEGLEAVQSDAVTIIH